jgi:23S rRNA pseudouridine2605 synthase
MAGRRISAALADAGVASRRAAEALVRAGRVSVDGVVVTDLATRVEPGQQLAFDGSPVGAEQHEHWLLNKPPGVISTLRDPGGRTLVTDLVPSRRRLYPVGRLDADSGGLIVLTNDGELAARLMHPRHQVDKTYRLVVEGSVSRRTAEQLAKGVELDDGPTAPAKVKVERAGEDESVLIVTIHEGRKRQLRRMGEAVGHPVTSLLRIGYGPLTMRGLDKGAARHLTGAEVERLRRLVGLGGARAAPAAGGRAKARGRPRQPRR